MSATLPLLLLACNSVSGVIDGVEVPITSAFYVEAEDAYGADGLIVVHMFSLEGGCEQLGAFYEDFDDADDAEEKEDAWREHLPEEFWEIQMHLRVDDVDDDQTGLAIEGVDWDEVQDEDDQVKLFARRFTDWPRDESFTWWGWFTGDVSDYYDLYLSDRGEGEISRHIIGERIDGRFDTMMVDNDGDDEGEVSVAFRAERCRAVEDVLY